MVVDEPLATSCPKTLELIWLVQTGPIPPTKACLEAQRTPWFNPGLWLLFVLRLTPPTVDFIRQFTLKVTATANLLSETVKLQ